MYYTAVHGLYGQHTSIMAEHSNSVAIAKMRSTSQGRRSPRAYKAAAVPGTNR